MKVRIQIYRKLMRAGLKFYLTGALLLLSCIPARSGNGDKQDNREQFNVTVNLGYEWNDVDLSKDSIDFSQVESRLMAKVNELAKNRKFSIRFGNEVSDTTGITGNGAKPDLILNISLQISRDQEKRGVNVYYSEDNDYTFQSIKFANMVVSEAKASRLNLRVNGMIESDMSRLKDASAPALQVEINLSEKTEDLQIITNEEKLMALARLIYECIERISKS